MPSDASQILVPFGFTSLESEIYTFLLGESPATGYRVGQALGKAAANTYKAIESLHQKGAVLIEEGTSRLCRAVPSSELLARLTRDFEWRRAEAELMLANLDSEGGDDRIYALRSRAQVIERARHMLGTAEIVVLLACSNHIVDQLGDAIASCVKRPVNVVLMCPEPVRIDKVDSAVYSNPSPLDEIRLVTDGSEFLLGQFVAGREEVAQASWSKSPYLSICMHRGLSAELQDAGLRPTSATDLPAYGRLVRT